MASLRQSAVLLLATAVCSAVQAQDSIQYNRDIRPILNDACFACHGPDSASRKGELRLDLRDAAVEKGAIAPGHADESEMIRRLLSDDPEEVMPPPELKKTLTPEQKKLLTDWIQNGAEYQQHWSYIAPTRPALPEVPESVRTTFGNSPKNGVDHFILKDLAASGLTPAAQTDRHTLARRASFDIIGLPPTPEMV